MGLSSSSVALSASASASSSTSGYVVGRISGYEEGYAAGVNTGSSSTTPPPPQMYPSSSASIPTVRPEGDAKDEDLCGICKEYVANVLLDPCGHLKYCGRCVRQIKECAYCRAPINKPIRAFK